LHFGFDHQDFRGIVTAVLLAQGLSRRFARFLAFSSGKRSGWQLIYKISQLACCWHFESNNAFGASTCRIWTRILQEEHLKPHPNLRSFLMLVTLTDFEGQKSLTRMDWENILLSPLSIERLK